MKNWLFLFIAIIAEVIATSALKSSEGFTKPIASIVVVLGYMIAFYCLSLTLKTIPVGIAYAVWSGVGIVLITTVAWFVFDQKLDVWGDCWYCLDYEWCIDLKLIVENEFSLVK